MKLSFNAILTCLVFLLSDICHARDYSVPSTGPRSSIQAAINLCRSGDRILLATGVYNQRINITKAITLQGNGAEQTILDGQGTGPVIQVTCPGIVRINRCTIRNGVITAPPDQPAKGGGIYNLKASLYIVDVCVMSNAAWGGEAQIIGGGDALGGGVFSTGPLNLRNCRFENNEVHGASSGWQAPPAAGRGLGGGVYASARLLVDHCVFTSNSCWPGHYYSGPDNLGAGGGCCAESNLAELVCTDFEGNNAFGWNSIGAGYAQLKGRGQVRSCSFEANSSSRGAFGNTGNSHLDSCSFVGNSADEGGGVLNEGTLSISKSTFDANASPYGAGICNVGLLRLTSCLLEDNEGPFPCWGHPQGSMGGGIHNAGTATIEQCCFAHNGAEIGGAIYNQATLRLIDSSLTENSGDAGGGVLNEGGARLECRNTQFTSNSCLGRSWSNSSHGYPTDVHGQGGAIYNAATAIVLQCVFEGNLTTGVPCWNSRGGAFGGAILNTSLGSLAIEQSTFYSNSVRGTAWSGGSAPGTDVRGGAIFNDGFTTFSNSTFCANWAQNDEPGTYYNGALDGGAVFNNGTAMVSHCTFVSNTLVPIGDVPTHCAGTALCAFGPVTIGNSIVEDLAMSDVHSCWGDFVSTGWNLIEDTSAMTSFVAQSTDRLNVDAKLGPIVNIYQGHLVCLPQFGSPALDAGSIASARLDQRGARRPRDILQYTNVSDGSDIGAVEMLNFDVALTLESVESTLTLTRAERRIVLQNVGIRPVKQVMVAVLLPASSRLASCSHATIVSTFGRLVFLMVGAIPASQRVEIGLMLTAFSSGSISARAYSSPADEFMANNTMTLSMH